MALRYVEGSYVRTGHLPTGTSLSPPWSLPPWREMLLTRNGVTGLYRYRGPFSPTGRPRTIEKFSASAAWLLCKNVDVSDLILSEILAERDLP